MMILIDYLHRRVADRARITLTEGFCEPVRCISQPVSPIIAFRFHYLPKYIILLIHCKLLAVFILLAVCPVAAL